MKVQRVLCIMSHFTECAGGQTIVVARVRANPLNKLRTSARALLMGGVLSLCVSISVANVMTTPSSDTAVAPLNDVLWVGLLGALISNPATVDS